MVFAWYIPNEEAPLWDLPVVPEFEDPDAHVEVRYHAWDIEICIQEIAKTVWTPRI